MGPEEEAQFSVYVTARRDRVRRTAYLLCGDWHRADDLTQIAFVKLYGAWSGIRDYGALDGFVRRCLMRAAVDESRRPWRREHTVDDLPDTPAPTLDLASVVADRQLVRTALDEVPPGQRAMLVLRFFDGLDVAATAAAMECSEGNVKSQTARGLAAMKQALIRQGAVSAEGGRP
ncbi:SigE family RNA polymerase sigma factor [Nakamurella multipartita]|jgi:RNA polymerase sigma-70 factor (sigma-E family)|uniref:RNA polymerase, sigma-24 subunit, ECF subfamily n=1 Tax=Nakamurella multipartita (strain ATCC 700099 / DSM 44233 / CIP 104796 / JCM 9543 / NBRC 105858 / Y-104) TaxID=479431 RepID=C8XB70_NAKMY|nr:SigE family RNA polymerase sigma factor [Nakamurella multipartita]ACV81362.1 RNA polymerase, sigma-24 subunit, ECF subfamily [Nakamurella multipartita DSM 44233]HOZ60106.1 SigE family RNA polymerase sigma factor [Nakamurella multipartita]